jgi:drug/metabolite transporter (DMT)-like permease
VTAPTRYPLLAFAALATSGVLWGTSFILGKIALRQLGVNDMMLYRFMFASLGFLPLLARRLPRFDRHDFGLVLIASLVGVPVQFLLQFGGLALTTASHAALMIGMAPVLLAVAAHVVLHERHHRSTWAALLVSTVGVALIVLQAGTGNGSGSLPGDMMVLVSMVGAVAWVLISKTLMHRHSALVVSGTITLCGTVMLAAWVIGRYGLPSLSLDRSTWLAVAALGLITTTCTTVLWNWGLSHVSAGRAGAFINLEPVVGAVLGVWLLHEHLGSLAIAGGLLILVAAVGVTLQET